MTDRPRFTSVSVYNHPQNHLSFWYPTEWDLRTSDSPHVTVTLLPNPTDSATNITIEVKDFPGPVAVEDHTVISEGVKAGLAQLDECVIERWRELGRTADDTIQAGDWGLEWICTFMDEGQRRKRRARLFFTKHHLYSVICQGSTEDVYGFWQGMLEYVLLTVGVNQFSTVEWAAQQAWEEQ